MKAQLSIDFLIAISILIIIAGTLIVFFLPFTTPNYTQIKVDTVCSYISNSISSLAATPSNSSFIYIPLLESYGEGSLNVSISGKGIIVRSKGYASACASIPNSTANESFLTSNLWAYRLPNGDIYTAYFYGGASSPNTIFSGGGFYPSASIYIVYPNGTATEIASSLTSPFTYNAGSVVATLKPGMYYFYAENTNYPKVKVSFPLFVS